MSGNIASGNAASSNGETRNDGHVDGNAQQQLRNEKILNTLSKMNFPQFNGSDKEFRNWVTQIKANLEYVSGERLVGMIESIDPMVRFSHWWNIRAVSIIFAKLLAAVPQPDKSMLMTCGKWQGGDLRPQGGDRPCWRVRNKVTCFYPQGGAIQCSIVCK